ncbi:hypothetical protein OCU04_007224 [Sclerotinia nivalis]|uniref:Uncharacterized protein n=1 Tax=Sclerotinia nivalis TaxID=352851 RepID=A0A9X0DJR0_9HELO|nr:hypothetical protein OCU04_007224 [Sclerotinia nivalis]
MRQGKRNSYGHIEISSINCRTFLMSMQEDSISFSTAIQLPCTIAASPGDIIAKGIFVAQHNQLQIDVSEPVNSMSIVRDMYRTIHVSFVPMASKEDFDQVDKNLRTQFPIPCWLQ